MDKTALGDRMKGYEAREAKRKAMPLVPLMARLDGKGFSRFTRGLKRPFDVRLSHLMRDTTVYLVEQTQAVIGYTQSDEISLVFYSDSRKSQVYLDGRIQKLTSIMAATATAFFNRELAARIPEKAHAMPLFDCRVWSVPTKEEAVNALLWRERDATKNSISMAARAHYEHDEVLGKSGAEMQEMLHAKGVNWNDYPAFFKRGLYIRAEEVARPFSQEELDALPPKHAARTNPDLVVKRRVVRPMDSPPLGKVVNRVEVVFDGAAPEGA